MAELAGLDCLTKWTLFAPLKHRRYPVAMTVCIAARCTLSAQLRGFIICTDGRLDQGTWGYSDDGHKLHGLGYNFFGLMAGSWTTAREFCSRLELEHWAEEEPPHTAEEVVRRWTRTAESFSHSPLCKGEIELLTTGFILNNPILTKIKLKRKKSEVTVVHDLDAIGEGSYSALTLLRYRGYDPLNVPVDELCYLIYEAKRFSEGISSVGPVTRIKIHSPSGPPGCVTPVGKEEYIFHDLPIEMIQQLEEKRTKYFLRPGPFS